MKRMSEVFTLPVYVDIYGLNNANAETLIDGYDADSEHLKHAAHAINNCDALADTLETVLAVISGKTEFNVSEIDIDSCYKALQAYRGTK